MRFDTRRTSPLAEINDVVIEEGEMRGKMSRQKVERRGSPLANRVTFPFFEVCGFVYVVNTTQSMTPHESKTHSKEKDIFGRISIRERE